jgi:hypothetical protein
MILKIWTSGSGWMVVTFAELGITDGAVYNVWFLYQIVLFRVNLLS